MKIANFQFGTKSGPTCHWANLEQKAKPIALCFDDISPFWSTLHLAQKVAQLVTEPICSKKASLYPYLFMKIANFQFGTKSGPTYHRANLEQKAKPIALPFHENCQLSIWYKKWSNLSPSQFVAKKGKPIALPFHEKKPSLPCFDFQFGTKSGPTCHRANLEQKAKPIALPFHENCQLSIWYKKWSNLSPSQFGAKRQAYSLMFWWY